MIVTTSTRPTNLTAADENRPASGADLARSGEVLGILNTTLGTGYAPFQTGDPILVASTGDFYSPPAEPDSPCQNTSDRAVKNPAIHDFCEVTPGVLWRGEQPGKEGAARLMNSGVGTVVDLTLFGGNDKEYLSQANVAKDKNSATPYFRVRDSEVLVAVAPWAADDNVAHFLAIVDTQPLPVYVHCRAGRNRTGVMVAAYRVLKEGMDVEAAISEMKRYKGEWFGVDARYIRSLATPERRAKVLARADEWKENLKMNAVIVCTNGECTIKDQE